MQTRIWGPSLWHYSFIMCRNYPNKIDINNEKHLLLKKQYKDFFINLQYLLPCKFCRKSYKQFIKELPIDKYLNNKNDITYWFYLIKDKVNKKLINQEKELLNS